MYDAVVIGAGIEGSSAAYNLVKKGNSSVVLLEQVQNIIVYSDCVEVGNLS